MIGSETLRSIKFSVEIECKIPRSRTYRRNENNAPDAIRVGEYHNGIQVPAIAGREWAGWTCESDGSLRTSGHVYRMVEFVGPVVSGPEGIQEISDFLAALRSIGCKVNPSCGLHINISHPGLFKPSKLRRLISLTARHEQALWAVNGSPTRESNTTYCKTIKKLYKDREYDSLRSLENITRNYEERYYTLNLQNLFVTAPNRYTGRVRVSANKRRVEFRVLAGTVNSAKVRAYLRVFLGLVELAITGKGKPSWDIVKPDGDSDLGDGVYALRRLFVSLGWKPAAALRSQIRSGNIRGIVTANTAPWATKAKGIMVRDSAVAARVAEDSAAELMKMARKYDEILATDSEAREQLMINRRRHMGEDY
jgi:hypothetical protein